MVRARPSQECPMLAPLPALPGFRLQSHLGSRPSGHVHRARYERLSCDVAITLLDLRRCAPFGLAHLAAIASSPLMSGARRYEVVPTWPTPSGSWTCGPDRASSTGDTGPLAPEQPRPRSRLHHPQGHDPGPSPRPSSWTPSPAASHSPVSEAMSSPNSSGWSPPALPNPRWGSSESSAQVRLSGRLRVGKRSAEAATTRSPCA